MSKLKNEQLQIPGGFVFFQPEIKWQSRPWSSLDGITNDLINVRKGNPVMTKKYGWSTDFDTVRNEVEAFQVRICQTMGYTDYLADEGAASPPPPKLMPPQQQSSQNALAVAAASAKKIWAGAKILNEWLDSGEPGVEPVLAEQRAATCVACPLNGQGDFSHWFTAPAADLIRKQLERVQERKLATSQDAKLNICEACLCPMKLKVHTPMKFIQNHLKPEVVAALRQGKDCWILQETK